MNVCFETSTLVAALLEKHPHHRLAFPHLQAAHKGKITAYLTTHALAELFATLTALPLKPRLLPHDVERLIEISILPHFEVISLAAADYHAAISMTVTQNRSSGAIYDALHIIGARNAHCKKLLTLNLKHFRGLAPGEAMIVSP